MKSIIIIGGLLVLVPNIFNSRERKAFGSEERVEKAREMYPIDELGDSVVVPASKFYKRGSIHRFFYGEKYRNVWSEPIKVKVFDVDTVHGGMTPTELGGGMQTIGVDLLDKEGRKFDMRSVNKDQSNALPKWLKITYARTMFRDQAAAMNPYASLIVPKLADAVGIAHTYPTLYFMPYDPEMDSVYRQAMAGRMVIVERNLNDSWTEYPPYKRINGFYDTEEMFAKNESSDIGIDTLHYLKNRLFDILINDWDRHEGQWEWALMEKDDSLFFKSYPKDRDMAFYDFRGGAVNAFALLFSKKFQSFTPDYKNIKALSHNSRELDKRLLLNVSRSHFKQLAENMKNSLNDQVIDSAFKQYPPEIYKIIGEEHKDIFRARREKLVDAAESFYNALR